MIGSVKTGIRVARHVARCSAVQRAWLSTNPTILDLSKFASDKSRLPREALERDIKLRQEHFAKRMSYPDAAQPTDPSQGSVTVDLGYRKRLMYRSKQRGWLEVDLLLGSWAAENVMKLSDEECIQYEAILNCETLDIYNMITKQMPIPQILQTPMMTRLQEYAASQPVGVADPKKYADIKKLMSN